MVIHIDKSFKSGPLDILVKTKDAIRLFDKDNMWKLNDDNRLFLIACFKKGIDLKVNLYQLQGIATLLNDYLMVGYITDELFDQFKDTYNICGTPTYLIFLGTKNIDTLLGTNSTEGMISFIQSTLTKVSGSRDNPNIIEPFIEKKRQPGQRS